MPSKPLTSTILLSLLLIFILSIALPFAVYAAESTGLVTCGLMSSKTLCNICDLVILFQTLVNKANSYFAFPLAALMLGYGGFLMVLSGFQGGNAGLYTKGTKVLTNTLIGIIIIFCSWLAIDTLLKTVGAYQHNTTGNFGPWNVIECVSPDIKLPTRIACVEDQCKELEGTAPAGCTLDSPKNNCGPLAEHLGCEAGMCKWIKGEGKNDCTEGEDPMCGHKGCDGTSCTYIIGESGPNECDVIGDNDPKCTHGTTTEYERNFELAEKLAVIPFTSANPDCDGKSAATNYKEMLNNESITVCHATCKTDKLPCTKKRFTAKPEMMENLVSLAYDFDLKFEVTSIATGKHSQSSDHYKGKGVDLSTAQNNYVNIEQGLNELKDKGSPIRDIRCEQKGSGDKVPCNAGDVGHIHVSYN